MNILYEECFILLYWYIKRQINWNCGITEFMFLLQGVMKNHSNLYQICCGGDEWQRLRWGEADDGEGRG